MNNGGSSGRARATIDDVARAAGVSTATVSRALRNRSNVAEGTRLKVLEVAEQLLYVANPNAAALASGQTRTIGLLAPLLTSWYTSEVVAGVEEIFAEARYDLLIGTANPLARERIFRGDARFQQRTDGVILVDVFCSEAGALQLAALGAPAIVLGERLHEVTSVSVDNVLGARMAAQHLIDLGHRRVGLVGGHAHLDAAHKVAAERTLGFESALQNAGLELDPHLAVDGHFTIEGGRAAMHFLMSRAKPPTAVWLMSDEMAFGALQATRELGLVAGRDVSLIGFDDHPVSAAFGLTTVRQPVRDIGRLGARLMVDRLQGNGEVRHYPVDLTLISRTTCGEPGEGER